MIRNIPHLALIPIVILWFGIEEEAKLFLVALGTFFPIYLNTFHGIRSVDKSLIEMAHVYELKGFSMFWHIIFPAALPSILVGVRYALSNHMGYVNCSRNDCSKFWNWLHGYERKRIYAT